MQNSSDIPQFSILSALATFDDLFGVRIKESSFEEWSRMAIKKVGTNVKDVKLHLHVLEEGMVQLPCKAFTIKAVSANFNEYTQWGVDESNGNIKATPAMGVYQWDTSPGIVVPGSYVDFTMVDAYTLRVDPRLFGTKVYILLKEIVTDGDGESLFTEKQIEAIAYYVMYLMTQRDIFAGKKVPVPLETILGLANQKISQAKTPTYISDNQMDAILNVKTSFGRKSFNRDYKS